MINVLIVDDEPNPRDDLKEKISTDLEFNIIGTCGNAFEAIKEINSKHPDVVFLDIEMPQITGLEMLCMLDKDDMPRIVFVTAYSKYAVEAFEKNAIDFLLKPVKMDRLNITLERLKENCQPQPNILKTLSTNMQLPTKMQFVPCYKDACDYLINIKDICRVFSSTTTGVHIVTRENCQEFHTELSLKVFEENTPLIRCHQQNIVSLDCIKIITKLKNGLGEILTHCGTIIPISRKYMKNFRTTF